MGRNLLQGGTGCEKPTRRREEKRREEKGEVSS